MVLSSELQKLVPLEHPVAPGMQEPVGHPLLPPPLLLGHGHGPALGGQPGPVVWAHPGLLQAAEQGFGHRADGADGELPMEIGEVGRHPPLGLIQPNDNANLRISEELKCFLSLCYT